MPGSTALRSPAKNCLRPTPSQFARGRTIHVSPTGYTAATWLMQRAAPMWEAAGFLGMSEMTLRETYGITTRPTLRTAANAIGTHSAPSKNVGLVVSLVDEKTRRERAGQALLENTGGPGRTRTCNQTVMSGRL